MKRLFFLIFIFFGVSLNLSASNNALSMVIDNLHKKYDNISTYKADFVQVNFFKAVNQVQKFSGTLYLKKPDKMRWDYVKPEVQSIISNGKKIWYFYPEENQANYADLSGKSKENSLIFMLLEGIKKVESTFYMRLISGNENNKFFYLQLLPKKPNTEIKKVILTVSKKDFSIKVSHVFYATNDISKVIFKNVSLNIKLDDSFFNFTPAPGCEVFKIPSY